MSSTSRSSSFPTILTNIQTFPLNIKRVKLNDLPSGILSFSPNPYPYIEPPTLVALAVWGCFQARSAVRSTRVGRQKTL
jgi:hypothetical protein